MKIQSILLSIIVFVLSACTTYKEDWVPPSTAAGTACVSQCNDTKLSCQVSQQVLAQQCDATYNRAMADYQSCKAKNPATSYCTSYRTKTEVINGQTITKQECTSTRYESPCQEPVKSCSTTSSNITCDNNFKACFVSCGGTINRYEVK